MTTNLDRKDSSAIQLFETLWQKHGHHFVATRDPATGKFTHISICATTHASAIVLRTAKAGHDVYFAPASFKSSDSRKSENAIGATSLWMDIDVGPDKGANGSGYATIEAALDELYIFCDATGIPRPTLIICSGSGLHVYWVLDQFIGPKLWLMLATKLKALTKHLNFRADPSRTADISSLMRVPGTLNYKYTPPLPVEMINASDTLIKLCLMADAITAAYDRLVGDTPPKPNNGFVSFECVDMALLEAILLCLDPDMTYCEWYRVAAGMFNFSKDTESAYELFDAWSSKGRKYKGQTDTLKLWRSLRPDHPKPVKIATLRLLVEEAGYDWQKDVVAVANEQKGGA